MPLIKGDMEVVLPQIPASIACEAFESILRLFHRLRRRAMQSIEWYRTMHDRQRIVLCLIKGKKKGTVQVSTFM